MTGEEYENQSYQYDGIVYGLICPLSKRTRYIGSTWGSLYNRVYSHKRIKTNSEHSTWINELKQLNILDKLSAHIIEEGVDLRILREREIYWIKHYAENGFDLTNKKDNPGSLIWTPNLLLEFVNYANKHLENKNIYDIVGEFKTIQLLNKKK